MCRMCETTLSLDGGRGSLDKGRMVVYTSSEEEEYQEEKWMAEEEAREEEEEKKKFILSVPSLDEISRSFSFNLGQDGDIMEEEEEEEKVLMKKKEEEEKTKTSRKRALSMAIEQVEQQQVLLFKIVENLSNELGSVKRRITIQNDERRTSTYHSSSLGTMIPSCFSSSSSSSPPSTCSSPSSCFCRALFYSRVVIECSNSFISFTGFPKTDLLSGSFTCPSLFSDKEEGERCFKDLCETCSGPVRKPFSFKRKDGSEYSALLTISVDFNYLGVPSTFSLSFEGGK